MGAFVFLVVTVRVWSTTFTWIGGDASGEVGLAGKDWRQPSEPGHSKSRWPVLRLAGGGGGAWTVQAGRVAITPYVELGWRHEFDDDARPLSAQIGGSSFAVQGIAPSAEGWNLAAGFDAALRDNLSIYAQIHREQDTAVTKSTDFKLGMRFNF